MKPAAHPTNTTIDGPDLVFYDGTCGLCHRAVRFLVRRDRDGRAFVYAPLGGDTFRARVPDEPRRDLPDSIAVLTSEGRLLTRSAAILHCGARLKRPWPWVAAVAGVVPRWLRDGVYDLVASTRYRLFTRPERSCPVLPPELGDRFLD